MTDPQAGLRRVFYVSLARLEPAQLDDLLAASRRNNRRDAITGVLLYTGGAFAQVVEGPPAALDGLLQRLATDARHAAMRVLLDEPAAQRQAQSWEMHLVRDEGPDDLLRMLVQEEHEIAQERARAVLDGLLQPRD